MNTSNNIPINANIPQIIYNPPITLFSPIRATATHRAKYIEDKRNKYKNPHMLSFFCKYTTLFDIIKLYSIFYSKFMQYPFHSSTKSIRSIATPTLSQFTMSKM